MSQLIKTTSQTIVNGKTTREVTDTIEVNPTEKTLWEVTVPDNTNEAFSFNDVGTPKVLIFRSTHEVIVSLAHTSGTFTNIPLDRLTIKGSDLGNLSLQNRSGFEVTVTLELYGNLV